MTGQRENDDRMQHTLVANTDWRCGCIVALQIALISTELSHQRSVRKPQMTLRAVRVGLHPLEEPQLAQ